MTAKRMRIILRWVHLIFGLLVMCYIYSPFHELVWFQLLMKFIIIPVMALSGIWIWKFQAWNTFFKIQSSS